MLIYVYMYILIFINPKHIRYEKSNGEGIIVRYFRAFRSLNSIKCWKTTNCKKFMHLKYKGKEKHYIYACIYIFQKYKYEPILS